MVIWAKSSSVDRDLLAQCRGALKIDYCSILVERQSERELLVVLLRKDSRRIARDRDLAGHVLLVRNMHHQRVGSFRKFPRHLRADWSWRNKEEGKQEIADRHGHARQRLA